MTETRNCQGARDTLWYTKPQRGGGPCILVRSSDLYRFTEYYIKSSTKRILRLQSQALQRWEMPTNLHTHPGCLHYDTTPSYTTTYHFPLNKLTLFFVLSYLFHLPLLSQVLLIIAPFLSCPFFLPPASAAEHSWDHHSIPSVSRVLCFRLSVHNTASVWPVRRHTRDGAHPVEAIFLQFNQ